MFSWLWGCRNRGARGQEVPRPQFPLSHVTLSWGGTQGRAAAQSLLLHPEIPAAPPNPSSTGKYPHARGAEPCFPCQARNSSVPTLGWVPAAAPRGLLWIPPAAPGPWAALQLGNHLRGQNPPFLLPTLAQGWIFRVTKEFQKEIPPKVQLQAQQLRVVGGKCRSSCWKRQTAPTSLSRTSLSWKNWEFHTGYREFPQGTLLALDPWQPGPGLWSQSSREIIPRKFTPTSSWEKAPWEPPPSPELQL